jgi:UDP-glucose 4-epimerase
VYGRSEQVPFREAGDRILGPTSVHRWSYATAKALDEHLAFAYLDRGLRVSIVRYFNAYGPRIHQSGYGSVIARFAWQALSGRPLTVHGDGRQTRCFTYVSDTIEGTIRAGTLDQAIGGVFNIGSAREVSIMELAREVRSGLRSKSEIRLEPYETDYPMGFEDTRRRVPDVARARARLGFEARIEFADGLARTLEWCRQNYEVALTK